MSATTIEAPANAEHASRRLWLFAAAGALMLHFAAVAIVVSSLRPTNLDDSNLGAPALEIGLDLAAPQATPTDLPPGPQMEASTESPEQAEQKPVEKQPDLPKETPHEAEDPDRLVATETPKPEQQTPVPQAAPTPATAEQEATAMPSVDATTPSQRSVAPAEGTSRVAEAKQRKWEGELVAYLNRHKRRPPNREQRNATVTVSFNLDRSGHIVSASVVGSSGDAAFDDAALNMLKRSDPVPAPPAAIADSNLSFTLPVIFDR